MDLGVCEKCDQPAELGINGHVACMTHINEILAEFGTVVKSVIKLSKE